MSRSTTADQLLAGELAKATGVSTDTLRHYERKGVLPRPRRSSNGYRLYPVETLDRVRLVRRALAVGFSLAELASILKAREGGGAPCHEVRDLGVRKLAELDTRLQEMLALRDELQSILEDWINRLSRTGPGEHARLLEALANSNRADGAPRQNPIQQLKGHHKRR